MKLGLCGAFVFLSLGALVVSPFFGAASVDFSAAFERGSAAHAILWELRIPRTCLAWLVGASLSICGLVFQAIFRNDLASPDMLGVSSGAALGAALYIRFGQALALSVPFGGTACASFAGAALSIALLCAAGGIKRGFSAQSLLLAGVALNFLFGSVNMIVHYTGGFSDSFRIMRWTMGGLETVGFASAFAALPGFIFILLVCAAAGPQLDLLLCGDEIAQSRGVGAAPLRRFLFAAVSLVVAVSVALCGPIGFVGLMCPHICRRLTSVTEHRLLAPLCALVGGFFLTICDAAARTLWSPAELPVGVLTSSLGALFFIRLLIRSDE